MKHASRFSVHPGWKLLLADMGIDAGDVLRLAELPGDLFARPGASLDPLEHCRLWQAVERLAGSAELPLRIGQAISAEIFDPPIFASLCSPNLEVALLRLARYKPLIGPMTLHIETSPGQLEVSLGFPIAEELLPFSLVATEMVFFVQLARMATRQPIVPLRVQLPSLPADLQPYQAFFGCSLRRGPRACVRFSESDAKRAFLTANPGMWDFFRPVLDRRLSELDADASMRQRVRGALLEMLPGGQVSIDAVARHLAMSKRSLQRHLGHEHCTYQDVLDDTRQRLAEHYLRQSTTSFAEVAYLLGFNDGATFNRAFKSWVGVTPGHYRARLPE